MQQDTSSVAEPAVLTVEEAAAQLRIGRNAAYALTRLWRDTAGREGLPVIVLGRSLRVPAAAIRELLEHPPIPKAVPRVPARVPRRMGTMPSLKSPPAAVRRVR